jgi:hypothetical protein
VADEDSQPRSALGRRRFARLLRDRGPALEFWPRTEREAARRLLARSGFCRARYLKALEREAAPARVDAGAMSRMLFKVRHFPRLAREERRPRLRPQTGAIGWGGMAAAMAPALALGVVLGVVSPVGEALGDPFELLHVQTLVEVP